MSQFQGRDIVLFGVSNMLSDIAEAIDALGGRVVEIVTNAPETVRERTFGIAQRFTRLGMSPRFGSIEAFHPGPDQVFGLGTTAAGRLALLEQVRSQWRLDFPEIVHPAAYVSRFVTLGQAVFVGAGSVIGPCTTLGDAVFVNRGATIGHDTLIGAGSRIMPGSNVGGHVRIGTGVTIGMGASVIEELHIGDGAFVAAGAVVVRDVAEGERVAGVPARPMIRAS